MARIGVKEGLAQKALDSVKERLDTKYGIMILQPAYTQYYLNLGEISSYPPGYKENAGIFCHNNPWVSIAETSSDAATELLRFTRRPARLHRRYQRNPLYGTICIFSDGCRR